MLGPVVGSFVYAQLGYMATFFFFSGILAVNCLGVYFALPASLNHRNQVQPEEQTQTATEIANGIQRNTNVIDFPHPENTDIFGEEIEVEVVRMSELGGNCEDEEVSNVTYSMFLFNRRSLYAYICCSLIGIYTSFNYSFLSLVLTQDFGVSDS